MPHLPSILLTLFSLLLNHLHTTNATTNALPQSIATYGATAATGVPVAPYASLPNSFSAIHLSLINSTIFEWWYFSTFSTAFDNYFFLTFLISTGEASVSGLPGSLILEVAAGFIFPNGSGTFSTSVGVPFDGSLGSGAVGNRSGPGVDSNFTISPDFSRSTLTFGAPGVKGAIQMQSVAPAHYLGSANAFAAGQDMRVFPNVGWANPLPAAVTAGENVVNSTVMNLNGVVCYSDQD